MKNANRRKFLRQLSVLGAAVSTAAPAQWALRKEKNDLVPEDKNKEIKIGIFQTTDVHCQIHAHDEMFWENDEMVFRKTGGYGPLRSTLNQLRSNYKHSFAVDTGDMFQGSELSVKTTGEAFVPILNTMGYDLYLPGNWEVIYGKKKMQTLLGSLNAPKVCANMYHDTGTGAKGELIFPPYYIWYVEGIKIGFLGYTDHLVPLRQSPNYSKGIVYTKPDENLKHYVDILKNQEQCDFVIMVAHLGLSQQIALANNEDAAGIDYIFGGDTHERVRKPIQCKFSKVVEPGAFGSFIGQLELTLSGGKIINDSYTLVEVDASKQKPDIEMATLIEKAESVFKKDINSVVGYSTIPLYRYFVIENTIDTMVLDALSWKYPDVDVVLSNGFRFCPPRATPDHTGNIPIVHGYIYDMLPVDSSIRTAKVKGSQLLEWLEKELNNVFAKDASKRFGGWVVKFKGMQVKFYAFGETGKRVQEVSIRGKAIEAESLYSVLACERDGDPADVLCRIKGVTEAKNKAETLHQVMVGYLAVASPVTPKPQRNAVALDAPETLLTQVSGVAYNFH